VALILIDVNILIYASISDFPEHPGARDWLDSASRLLKKSLAARFQDGVVAVVEG
jgi:predicted nucleic acid-binding protein